jgi:transcription initiation factor TFIIIB Brf1 subunit/transcription initiation factor TFIIB
MEERINILKKWYQYTTMSRQTKMNFLRDMGVALRVGGYSFSEIIPALGTEKKTFIDRYRVYVREGSDAVDGMLNILKCPYEDSPYRYASIPLSDEVFLEAVKEAILLISGATEDELLSRRRHAWIVRARQLFSYILKKYDYYSHEVEKHLPIKASTVRAFYGKMEWEIRTTDLKDDIDMLNLFIKRLRYERYSY